jgi:hypothetical protein
MTSKVCPSFICILAGILACKVDEFVKGHQPSVNVIPAQAGIHYYQTALDSRLRGNDDNQIFYETIKVDQR